MESATERDLVIITNHEGYAYFEELRKKTQFDKDLRIKFVGTVYDQNELRYIREQAFAYLHGHEVGGTNPGLLEAMWSTQVNVVLGVNFNRMTAGDSVIYFDKENLLTVLTSVEVLSEDERLVLQKKAKKIINEKYTWEHVCNQYEELFLPNES